MNVRIQYKTIFNAAIHYSGGIVMNSYAINIWLNTNTTDPENHNTAFERMKYFLAELDSNVFVSSSEVEACKKYTDAGIKITTFPGDPVDQLVGIMLFYKLNAIMENRVSVLETEVSSTLSDGITYMHCENETITLSEHPEWWGTPDLVHCDVELIENENVVSIHHSTKWRDVDLEWPEVVDTESEEQENKVVFADFKKDENDPK